MSLFWRRFSKSPILIYLGSIQLTVTCLSLLFILTLWGTIAQVDQGLFAAQQRFFYSWFFLAFGFIPFPAAKLVLFTLFINLLLVFSKRLVLDKKYIGIIIIHLGLFLYFVAAYITYKVVEESQVTLLEQEVTNVSQSYHNWEIAIWEDAPADRGYRNIMAVDFDDFLEKSIVNLNSLGVNLQIDQKIINAKAFTSSSPEKRSEYKSQSLIVDVVKTKLEKEPEKNIPAVKVTIFDQQQKVLDKFLLYGEEKALSFFEANQKKFKISLRRQKRLLPFKIQLLEFKMQVHPGTETARSYESRVVIEHDGFRRESTISMNNPLRYRDWTIYQASYSIDAKGRKYSTLAVVKNWGRSLPYVASLFTFVGLATHFLIGAFVRKKNKK